MRSYESDLLVLAVVFGSVAFVRFSPIGIGSYIYVFYSHKRDGDAVKLLGIEWVIAFLFWPFFALVGVVKKLLVLLKYLITDFPILLFENSKSLLKWLFTRH